MTGAGSRSWRSAFLVVALAAATSLIADRDPDAAERRAQGLGVEALAQGRLEDAVAFLAMATAARDPALRFRALHNLALAYLLEARAGPAGVVERHARASVAAGRQALGFMPGSEGTKWNLALAEGLLPERSGDPYRSRGPFTATGSEAPSPNSTPEALPTTMVGGPGSPLTPEQATLILDVVMSVAADQLLASLAGRVTQPHRSGPPW